MLTKTKKIKECHLSINFGIMIAMLKALLFELNNKLIREILVNVIGLLKIDLFWRKLK